MKKLILSVAILAAAASCSKNEVESYPQGAEIAFATLNDRVTTKAANTNAVAANGTAGTQDDYKVYAMLSGASAWYIPGVTITSADAYATGQTKYFWPSKALDFFAFAPATTAVTDTTTGELSITYTVNATASEDFTVAQTKNVTKATPTTAVQLSFNHALSKAIIEVKLEESLAETSSFTLTDADFVVAKNEVTLDAATDITTVAATVAGAAATYNYDFSTPSTFATTQSATQELMFAPQAQAGCQIVLNDVTVANTEDTTATLVENTDITYTIPTTITDSFERGKFYKITITINADAAGMEVINFAATEVDWTIDSDSEPFDVELDVQD